MRGTMMDDQPKALPVFLTDTQARLFEEDAEFRSKVELLLRGVIPATLRGIEAEAGDRPDPEQIGVGTKLDRPRLFLPPDVGGGGR